MLKRKSDTATYYVDCTLKPVYSKVITQSFAQSGLFCLK